MEKERKSPNWRAIFIAVAFALIVSAFMGYSYFRKLVLPNVPAELADPFLYVPTGTDYETLSQTLVAKGFIMNEGDFHWVAEKMSFDKRPVRSGRFKIEPNWTNRELISHLRIGKQATVKVVLTDERLPEDVAEKAARFIEADSAAIASFLLNPDSLSSYGLTTETVITAFVPNTYDFYWNTDPRQFLERMLKEKEAFWDKDNRRDKAQALGLSENEIMTVASIVEKESNYKPERPRIAGVYLNRVKVGMKLQADPTCVFGTRDFSATRVTNYHLRFDSPYNTYMYEGLPPGPICMPSISSIDAVLNYEDHDYIFFCAEPNGTGKHAFAKTLRGHNVNVSKFRSYMRQRRLSQATTRSD